LPEERARHEAAEGISKAFLDMRLDALAKRFLATLKLDGFVATRRIFYSATLEKWLVVKRATEFLITNLRSGRFSWKVPLLTGGPHDRIVGQRSRKLS